MKPVVLLLSTYPYVKPQHGGQIRLANIAKAYKSAGWHVENIAIFPVNGYPKESLGPNDLPFPVTQEWRRFKGRKIPLIDDLLSGMYAASNSGGFPFILERLPQHINVIHVEQPWLWPLAVKIKGLLAYQNVRLVYGSQNIETPLKKDILDSFNIDDCADALEAIELLEKQAVQEADICFAVTEADRKTLLEFGAKKACLASNGINPWQANPDDLERWKQKLPTAPWILYVASAHPPNFTGFGRVVGDSLGFIPPDSRLVVAGSVSEHIYHAAVKTRWSSLNISRLQLLHTISNDDLAAVKSLAHAFLLPIPHGGGSNIKTAEAIYSGAYCVGTTSAFRGYENFAVLPEVMTADTPFEYQRIIKDVLQQPFPLRGNKDELRQTLSWDRCLASIPENVLSFVRDNHGK